MDESELRDQVAIALLPAMLPFSVQARPSLTGGPQRVHFDMSVAAKLSYQAAEKFLEVRSSLYGVADAPQET